MIDISEPKKKIYLYAKRKMLLLLLGIIAIIITIIYFVHVKKVYEIIYISPFLRSHGVDGGIPQNTSGTTATSGTTTTPGAEPPVVPSDPTFIEGGRGMEMNSMGTPTEKTAGVSMDIFKGHEKWNGRFLAAKKNTTMGLTKKNLDFAVEASKFKRVGHDLLRRGM